MSGSGNEPVAGLRVAVGQAPVGEGDVVGNAAIAAELTRRAGAQGARLLLLPEAFLTGYSEAVFAGPLPHPDQLPELLAALVAASTATGVTVLVSSALDRGSHRTLSLVRVAGRAVEEVYDKQHLVGYERDHLTAGTGGTTLLLDGWQLGLSICYDGSFPEHARAAADAGAHAYLNANAFFPGGSERQEIYCRARALDNGMYVVSAGYTGTTAGVEFVGGSAVHDPQGRRVGRMGTETGVLVADLSAELIRSTRAAHTMHADHRGDLGGQRFVEA